MVLVLFYHVPSIKEDGMPRASAMHNSMSLATPTHFRCISEDDIPIKE